MGLPEDTMQNSKQRLLDITREIVSSHIDQESAKDFDAAQWLDLWLEKPQPSLLMAKPADLLTSREGVQQVEKLLKRIAVGAFA